METVSKLSGMAGVVGLITSVGEVIYFNDQLNQVKKIADTIKQEFSNNLSKQHLYVQEGFIRQQKEIEALKRQLKKLEQPKDKKPKSKKVVINSESEEEEKPRFRRAVKHSETEEDERPRSRRAVKQPVSDEEDSSEEEEIKDENEDVNSAARYLLGM